MTIKAVEWAMRQPGLSSTAKLVLIAIADCINGADEFAFPRRAHIGRVAGLQDRQVRNHIRALEEKELIKCVQGPGAGRGKGRQPARYFLACDHITGQDKPLTTGNSLPPVKAVTAGNGAPPVTLTAGNPEPLQPAISGHEQVPSLYTKRTGTREPEEHLVGFPPPKPKPKTPKGGKRSRPAYRDDFEALWKSWPAAIRQNSDKRTAAARWDAALEQWDAETLMRAASHYLRGTKVNDADPGPWKPRTCQVQVFLNGKLEAAVEAVTTPKSKGEAVWSVEKRMWVEA